MNKERYRLNQKLSGLFNTALFSKLVPSRNARFAKTFGFTPDQLRKHLEQLFKPGMTWDNHGKWHIDHIVPMSSFCYESTKDVAFKLCWDLRNLQPLWGEENNIKGASQYGIWPTTSRLALNNQAQIVWAWKNGAGHLALASNYKTSLRKIRQIIIDYVGIDAYKTITKSRLKAGRAKSNKDRK